MAYRESYQDYLLDFSHDDLPEKLKKYEHIINKLERGESVSVAPDLQYSLPIELDKYYEKTTRGRVKTICSWSGSQCIIRLMGLPKYKTVEKDFDSALSNWWKYALAILFGLMYICLFFGGFLF